LAEVTRVISRDLEFGEFQGDLGKYKTLLKPERVKSPEPEPEYASRISLLWEKYVAARSSGISPTTLNKDYGRVYRLLSQLPTDRLENAVQIRDWIIKNCSPISARRCLVQLSACGKWAVKSGLIEHNPFADMAAQVAIPKSQKSGNEIDPFTPQERAAIIAGFEASPYYRYYAPLVQFLFLTGCRPAEALGLEWGHITDGALHFQQTSVNGVRGQLKQGLKTQSNRKFPINRQLQELIDSIPRVNQLVFPSPTGRVIDWGGFHRRAWKTVLKKVGVRYRKPYQTRHTFVTEALRRGLSVQDVAKLVGNSPQVIYAHYAGASRDLVVPEF
jgi:integrase